MESEVTKRNSPHLRCPNRYRVSGGNVRIVMEGSKHIAETIIDPEDMGYAFDYNWQVHSGGYAVTLEDGHNVYLHRLVAGAKPGQVIDHINGNKLDNRRCNLRLGTQADNMQNRSGVAKHSQTGLRGVRRTPAGRYTAYANLDGKRRYLGTYDAPDEAAAASAAFRAEHMPFSREAHSLALG